MKNYLILLSLAGVMLGQPAARAEEMNHHAQLAGGALLEAGAVASLYNAYLEGRAAREANWQAREQASAMAENFEKKFDVEPSDRSARAQAIGLELELEEKERQLKRAKEGYFEEKRVARVTSEKFAPGGDKLRASFLIYHQPVFVPPQGVAVAGPVMVNVKTVEVMEKYGPSRSVSRKTLGHGITALAAHINPLPPEQWIDIPATEARIAEIKKTLASPNFASALTQADEAFKRRARVHDVLRGGSIKNVQGLLSPKEIEQLQKNLADMKMLRDGGAKRLNDGVNHSMRLKILGVGLGAAGAALQIRALGSGESDVQAAEAGAASAQ